MENIIMKKIFVSICICALLLIVCGVLCGCKGKDKPQNTTAATTENEKPMAIPADGIMSCTKSGEGVTVNITLSECAGKKVSLVAISDPQYQYTWFENADICLSDIGQISLDKDGKGTLVLKLKGENEPAYIILTAESGSYIEKVK